MMKQKKKQTILLLLIGCLSIFTFPQIVLGDEAGMQNDVGIGFENDYEYTEPSGSTDEPAPTPPDSSEPPKTTPIASDAPTIKKPMLPTTGEKSNAGTAMTGVMTILIAFGVILWRRKKHVQ